MVKASPRIRRWIEGGHEPEDCIGTGSITALVVSALAYCALPATPAWATTLTAQQIADNVLALKQTKPAEVGLFSTDVYPGGPSMTPDTGPKPTEAQTRRRLRSYFDNQRGGSEARTAKALAVFDDPKVVARIPDPTLRAAFAGMVGTVFGPTIHDFLKRGIFTGIGYGITFPTIAIEAKEV